MAMPPLADTPRRPAIAAEADYAELSALRFVIAALADAYALRCALATALILCWRYAEGWLPP
jgi:hypothetical protein